MSKTRPGLRKQPRQERAQATVERILDAGARILIAYGYDGASTNRIAQAAGLSPGSLYQYFPNKDAIVTGVLDRLTAELGAKIAAPFRQLAGVSVEEGTKFILATLIDALAPQADLLRAIVDQVPRFGEADAQSTLLARGSDFVYHQLVANSGRLRHGDLDMTTWFVVQLTTHLSIRYIVDRPAISRDKFVHELTILLLTYVYRADTLLRAASEGSPSIV